MNDELYIQLTNKNGKILMLLLIDENAILPTLKSIKIKLNVGITIGVLSLPRLVNNNKNSIRKKAKQH